MAIFNFFKKSRLQSKKPIVKKEKSVSQQIVDSKPIKKAPLKKKEIAASRFLKEPHISEKATNLSEDGKYIFKVYRDANKSEIKKAISNLYGVAVKNINIVNIKAKTKLLKGKKGKKIGYKKAIVTLERGHKIEILPH